MSQCSGQHSQLVVGVVETSDTYSSSSQIVNVPHQDGLPSFLFILLLDKLSVTIHLDNALDFFLCLTV